jgi:hypothetical protein
MWVILQQGLPIRVIGCQVRMAALVSALLLHRALSERAGGLNVMYKSIAVFSRLQLPASLLAPALLIGLPRPAS